MPWRYPENFKSIRGIVNTQMTFKVPKLIKVMQSKKRWNPDFSRSYFEIMLEMSQKHDFWIIKLNTLARNTWSAFFNISCFSVYFQDQMS